MSNVEKLSDWQQKAQRNTYSIAWEFEDSIVPKNWFPGECPEEESYGEAHHHTVSVRQMGEVDY